MIPEPLLPIANHLWQSTLFAGMAGLIALALRKNSARVRHWVWVAASLKFLIPFSLLIAIGSRVEWRTAPAIAPNVSVVVEQVGKPFTFTADSSSILARAPTGPSKLPEILFGIWACGFIGISMSLWVRWRRIAAAVRAGSPVQLGLPIRAISSRSFLEPGVYGLFRPILLLPEGIFEHLTPEQWKSVVAHELCHVRHRDNLIAVVQMFVETIFWFHPVVWWMGKRIFQEREMACDEEVLRLGSEPGVYARSILRVCELYLESPLECVAGVTGSNLRKRIEAIMSNRMAVRMNRIKGMALAAAAGVAIAVPIAVGHLGAQPVAFEVASIKPSPAGLVRDTGGVQIRFTPNGFMASNVSLKDLVMAAYHMETWQVSGGPEWSHPSAMTTDDRFVVNARTSSEVGQNQIRKMLQTLLGDRFKMRFHRESRIQTVYDLVVAKNGPKLQEIQVDGYTGNLVTRCCRGGMYMERTTMPDFAASFTMLGVDTMVRDGTQLKGVYKFELRWTPEAFRSGEKQDSGGDAEPTFDPDGPSLFTALREQLGLALEARKGPVEILVIDYAGQPSEN